MPKISIIIPVYNVEDYLERTVKSVKSQNFKDIEIILINDGSTDKSGEICDKLKEEDNRIKVIHQQNKGVSAARNAGMNMAIGDYIAFVDADDLVEKDIYEILYSNAVNNNADLSMVSPIIKDLNKKDIYFNNTKNKYVWTSKEALENFFKGNVFNIAVYTKLLSRKLADKIRFEEGKAIHEDKYFSFNAIKNANKIVFEDTCKYIYIKRENSASTSEFSKKKLDAIYFADKIYKETEEMGNSKLVKQCYVDMILTKMLILRGIYRNKNARNSFKKEKEELINEIKKVNLKENKYLLPKQKIIEIFILQKCVFVYLPLVKIYDVLFK